jgi:zinc and cadmium transporter
MPSINQEFSRIYMSSYLDVILFSLLGGIASTCGGIIVISHKRLASLIAKLATPFAAGTLLGAAFFDLLPEALEHGAEFAALRWAVAGMVAFFLLEQYLDWFHNHHEHKGPDRRPPTVALVIIGDSIHNLIDGMVIGAAFLVSPALGASTTLAVAAHEIPQEIGDFGLLVKLGVRRRRVIAFNVLSALFTVAGALLAYYGGSRWSLPMEALLGVAAGMFVYIAASDLIPTIHARSKGRFARFEAALLILGVLMIAVVVDLSHEYLEAAPAPNESSTTHLDRAGN